MLEYTPEVERATAPLLERVKEFVPPVEWPVVAPYIHAINELKRAKNAVILAHNYQTPDIYHGVADFVGDSLQLAIQARETDAEVIVQAGVHFMAETSKLLSPHKTVLIPSLEAGCSLAASITGSDVRLLKEKYPGVPVVTYVNTSADVKAEADICCTSSNAVEIVESLGSDRVILLPDEYLTKNVAAQTDIEVIAWQGRCEVHERFTPREIRHYRAAAPGLVVLAHPECSPEVIREVDYAGSTAGMIRYVKDRPAGSGPVGHGVLHERQRGRGDSGRGVRAALQHVSSHEADHPRQHPRQPRAGCATRSPSPPMSRRAPAGRSSAWSSSGLGHGASCPVVLPTSWSKTAGPSIRRRASQPDPHGVPGRAECRSLRAFAPGVPRSGDRPPRARRGPRSGGRHHDEGGRGGSGEGHG